LLMPRIVLVHGIAQEQKTADGLETEWLPALAGGIRVAGYPEIADRVWRDRSGPRGIDARMAFYGHLFLRPGQQGDEPGELTEEEEALADKVGREWLSRAATRASKPAVQRVASSELAYLENRAGTEPQGRGRLVRSVRPDQHKLFQFSP
jgi:hypothetical protein